MHDQNILQALRLVASNPDKRCVIFVETRETAELLASVIRSNLVVIVPRPTEKHHVSPVTVLTALTNRSIDIRVVIVQVTTLPSSWCAPSGTYVIGSTYEMSASEKAVIDHMFSQSRMVVPFKIWRRPEPVQMQRLMWAAHMLDTNSPEPKSDGYVYTVTETAMRRFRESHSARSVMRDSDQSIVDQVCRVLVTEEGYFAMQASITNINRDWHWTDRAYFTIAQPKEQHES